MKSEKVDSETITACDLKLIELINICEYQRSRSFLTLAQGHLSPDYTVKLCFMKLESFIKFDHVAGLKTLFHETFWSFMKHIFG